MKTYVGTKIIQAEPMDEKTWSHSDANPHHRIGEPWGEGHLPRDGYLVVYPDGYHSWSPKEVFEEAYRELNPGEVEMVKTDP